MADGRTGGIAHGRVRDAQGRSSPGTPAHLPANSAQGPCPCCAESYVGCSPSALAAAYTSRGIHLARRAGIDAAPRGKFSHASRQGPPQGAAAEIRPAQSEECGLNEDPPSQVGEAAPTAKGSRLSLTRASVLIQLRGAWSTVGRRLATSDRQPPGALARASGCKPGRTRYFRAQTLTGCSGGGSVGPTTARVRHPWFGLYVGPPHILLRHVCV